VPKPLFKEVDQGSGKRNATQMLLDTVWVQPTAMVNVNIGPGLGLGADLSRITGLELTFDTSAGSGEIWIDSIQFVKK
jgi:hypothetical protein